MYYYCRSGSNSQLTATDSALPKPEFVYATDLCDFFLVWLPYRIDDGSLTGCTERYKTDRNTRTKSGIKLSGDEMGLF